MSPLDRNLSRRDLMKWLGIGAAWPPLHPVAALISGLAGGVSLRARAQGNGPRNYVFLYLESAPPRWHFDLLLHPFTDQSDVVASPGLTTGFVDGVPAYLHTTATVGERTWNLPPLWASRLPRPGGSTAPMSDLLTNMLTIRGCDMLVDGHFNNRIKLLMPVSGAPSLGGLVADASSRPLPAVALGGPGIDDAFFAPGGASQVKWVTASPADPLTQFFSPFQYGGKMTNDPVYAKRRNLDAVIELALDAMRQAATARAPGTEGLFLDRANAKRLIDQALGNLAETFAPLRAKYADLIRRSTGRDVRGINDQPLPWRKLSAAQRHVHVAARQEEFATHLDDLRDQVPATATVDRLAEGFAVAEFLLLSGHGSAVTIAAGMPSGLWARPAPDGAAAPFQWNLDEHAAGVATSTLTNAFYYRSIAACIMELKTRLGDSWRETVVHVGSEFSRAPRSDQKGSEHGFQANVTSIFSGAVEGGIAIGNVARNAQGPGLEAYPGTWGVAAPIRHDGTNGPLNVGHVTSTVATLLRVAAPLANFRGLVTEDSSGVHAVVEEAKNVGG